MRIEINDLTGGDIAALIETHVRQMRAGSPPGSSHAVGVDALRRPDITVWTAREGGRLLGCGALRDLGGGHGEIKSMRATAGHLRQGVGAAILREIIAEARRRGYARLSLETGAQAHFAPARRLYETHGFAYCPPFVGYREDPSSVFLTLVL